MVFYTNKTGHFLSKIVFLSLFLATGLFAQPNFNANNHNPPTPGNFRTGYNFTYYPAWTDASLASLATGPQGFGAKSTRQGLFYELFNTWGYSVRVPEVTHYKSLGMDELIGFILGGAQGGSQPYPPDAVRDPNLYCPSNRSELFANLYEPIWDNGANGTPYNENNYYAAYLYKTVNTYKDYVRYWEIWNEPGFDYANKGWRSPGDPQGNWWDQNPDPCEYRLRAPIQHYVRMLRISWEIIKTLDSDSYVMCGAPGYPSFLDAILRNTDAPDGNVSPDFPLKGGAYFDALSYHVYPHFDGSVTINAGTQTYMRNSDRAADGLAWFKNTLDQVLVNRGYNGSTYPKKQFIITEGNLPRKAFNSLYFGSEEAQRNYLMKAAIQSQRQQIAQYHVYAISERATEAAAVYEFDLMGMYKKIDNLPAASVQRLMGGLGLKTTSDLLFGSQFDPYASSLLAPPPGVRLTVFKKSGPGYWVALWAETKTDRSEMAAATYSFPTNISTGTIQRYAWDFAQTGNKQTIGPNNIVLTEVPMFLELDQILMTTGADELRSGISKVSIHPNPASEATLLRFYSKKNQTLNLQVLSSLGQIVEKRTGLEFSEGDHQLDLDLSALPAGIYWVQLSGGSGTIVRRIVVD